MQQSLGYKGPKLDNCLQDSLERSKWGTRKKEVLKIITGSGISLGHYEMESSPHQ